MVALSVNQWRNRSKEETPQTTQSEPRTDLQQPPPPQLGEGLQEVVDEAVNELERRGLMDKVAELTYGFLRNDTRIDAPNKHIGINLGFYNQTDPEVVKIVKSVIDKRAPGTPLDISENITIRLD
jgi:hypothetical protein